MRLAAIPLTAAAIALAASAARAQDFPAITAGQTVTGALTQSDTRLSERGPLRAYRFRARRGEQFIATMRSSEFDAYLTVARTVGGLTDYMKEDDDRGGETDARLRFTAPADGSYLLVAQSLMEDGVGSYTLTLEHAPEPTTAAPRAIRVGETIAGALAETDAISEDDDTFYDTYVVQASRGQRLVIDMKSDAFDSFLIVGTEEDGSFVAVATDDDGGGELNARATFTVLSDGPVIVRANALSSGTTGAYTISVADRGPRRSSTEPQPISAGQEVAGALSEDDAQLEDDSYFDLWRYAGTPGERVRIDMGSDAFDTFLAVGQLVGDTFEEAATNDDGPESTNSQLEVAVPSTGVLIIRTNSLSGEETGAYTLRVTPIP